MKKYIGLFTAFIIVAAVFIFIMVNKSNSKMTQGKYMSGQAKESSYKGKENSKDNKDNVDDKGSKDKQNNTSGKNAETSLTKDSQGNSALQSNSSSSINKKDILLVNKSHKLDKDYVPKNLVVPSVKFQDTADKLVRIMDKEAASALEEMFNAAKSDGITLIGVSGYRSYGIQKNVYESNVKRNGKSHADKYSAPPGASEHQTGLAMDMISTEYSSLETGFENTKAFKWLEANAYKYGYILRYPRGKEAVTGYNYEPWHYRYVGKEASEEITKSKLTLEEYLEENN